jgi:four helix bundle protein
MNRQELEERTKTFHLNVIKLCAKLPKHISAYEIARQLIRSAGSVASNYRASKRAKSTADFIYKIEIVLEEADESHYWLTIIRDAEIENSPVVAELIDEANQLTAIFASTSKTAKYKRSNPE